MSMPDRDVASSLFGRPDSGRMSPRFEIEHLLISRSDFCMRAAYPVTVCRSTVAASVSGANMKNAVVTEAYVSGATKMEPADIEGAGEFTFCEPA